MAMRGSSSRGRNPQHAAVAVTEGLLQQLPADEVNGVLAHEFGHIKNRDILVASIAATVDRARAHRPRVAARRCARNARTARADLPTRRHPATASLYIVNPLRRQGVAALFSTHPPIAERVRRLRALDADETRARVGL